MKSDIGSLFILLVLGAVLSYARPNMELQREAEDGIRVRRETRSAASLLTVKWEGFKSDGSSIRGFIVEYRDEKESQWHAYSGVIPYKGPNRQHKVQILGLPTRIYVVRVKVLGEKNEVLVDGVPSHKAEETQNLIRDNVPEFIEVDISSKKDNGDWPPNSPDLNVMDFRIWSILEAEACSKPYQSIEALKKSLVAAWNKIPQDVIDRTVDDFPKRLQKCIDAQGDHFENK
uniref:Uncharacterized protein n=1 Tax=Acrobeloides nanus TaxID=290746 RepID=A0A914BX80_9BILA